MTTSAAPRRTMNLEVLIYMGYLASFLVLLYVSTALFGDSLVTIAFGGFVVGAIAIVAAASRSLIY